MALAQLLIHGAGVAAHGMAMISPHFEPATLVAANLSIADVADRLAREHRLKAVGRLDRERLQYQVLADTVAAAPLDLEDLVVVEKNGQPLRYSTIWKRCSPWQIKWCEPSGAVM